MIRAVRAQGLALAVCLAGWLAVTRFVYPGYLDPFTPFHSDFYLGYEYRALSLTEILLRPRPVHVLFFHYATMLGFKAAALIGALLGVFYAYAVQALFATVSGRRAGLLALAAYFALCFAHDGFYFSYSYDSAARLSGILALIGMALFWSYLEERRERWRLLAAHLMFLLSIFSKETFALPFLLFVAATAAWKTRSARETLRQAIPFGLLFLVALWIATLAPEPFVSPGAGAGNPYRITFDPRTVLANVWSDASSSFLAPLPILLALALLWRDRLQTAARVALFWAMGLLSFLPYAMLPNHRLGYHVWQGIPFLYVFALALRPEGSRLQRWAFGTAAAALVAGSAMIDRTRAVRENWWFVLQQTINRNLLADFTAHARDLSGRKRTGLFGFATLSFHPWHHPTYINELLDYHGKWLFPSASGGRVKNVEWVTDIASADLDCAVFVGKDGHLIRILDGTELGRVTALLRSREGLVQTLELDGAEINAQPFAG